MATNKLQDDIATIASAPEVPPAKVLSRPRVPSWLKGAGQIVIGAAALAYIISKSDSHELVAALRTTRLWYMPLAVATTLVVYWLMAYRWKLILAARGYRPRTSSLFVYYLIGSFFSNFVPGGSVSTDVVRMLYVNREVRDRAYVVTTLLYDRFLGMFVLLLVGMVSAVASRSYLPSGVLLYCIEGVFIVAVLISLFLMSEYLAGRLSALALYIGRLVGLSRMAQGIARVLDAMSEVRGRTDIILQTLGVSLLMRIAWTAGFIVIALAMNLGLGVVLIFALIAIVDLIRMLPITPNGLGLREGAMVVLLGQVGIAHERALMFSLLSFAPLLLLAIVGGVIYMLHGRLRGTGNVGTLER
jgi:glycosyltransferase 2 family protein